MARWLVLLLVLAVAVRAWRSLDAPAVATERSEQLVNLHAALFTDAPRPTGSPEAAAARARVAAALTERGCPVHEQVAWSCVSGRCAKVTNLWCRMGPTEGSAVVGLSHTDSVGAGPGAGDAGAGVVAWVDAVGRLAHEPLRRPFVLVLTDGEELGLLGARALLDDPPFPQPIGDVVNLEARGTRGASLLFETVGPPLAWGTVLARSGVRPNGSSAYTAVYDAMPNDTDLSVVRRHGLRGVNHAFIGGGAQYHTPLDDLQHLDPRTLAQHAEAAFGHVRALQDPPAGEQAFTDVLALFVLRWPVGLGLPATVGLLLTWLAWLVADLRGGRTAPLALGKALLASVASLAVAVMLAEVARPLVGLGWFGNPAPLRVAVIATTLASLLPLGAVADPFARWHAVLGPFALLGLGLAWVDPRLTVLTLPALVLALGGRFAPSELGLFGLAPALAIGWLPYAFGLEDALGLLHPAVVALPLWVALAGTTPALPGRGWIGSAGLLLVAGIALVVGSALPEFTPDRPRPESLRVEQMPDEGELPPPRATEVDGGWQLAPSRGGWTVVIESPAAFVVDDDLRLPAGRTELVGVPPEGVRIEPAVPLLVAEITPGVPAALAGQRAPAVPIHRGDQTIVWTRLTPAARP